MFLPLLQLVLIQPAHAEETVQRRLAAMGTELNVLVTAPDRAAALAASEAAVRAVEETEARLSAWRADSELSRLNAAPVGTRAALSPALTRDLALAAWCVQETGGAFDPAVSSPGLHLFTLEGPRAQRTAPITLDSGGFGKGVALDAALIAAARAGATSVQVDLGGQLAVLDHPLVVDLADPRDRKQAVAAVALQAGSIATSGNSERPGHLIDPRSGEPAPDFGSLAVLAPSAAQADCLSTGLFVLGPAAALAWADDHDGFEVVVVEHARDGGAVRGSSGVTILPLGGTSP